MLDTIPPPPSGILTEMEGHGGNTFVFASLLMTREEFPKFEI